MPWQWMVTALGPGFASRSSSFRWIVIRPSKLGSLSGNIGKSSMCGPSGETREVSHFRAVFTDFCLGVGSGRSEADHSDQGVPRRLRGWLACGSR